MNLSRKMQRRHPLFKSKAQKKGTPGRRQVPFINWYGIEMLLHTTKGRATAA